ncbi:hypothetical protein Ga0074812_15517 [Parafrankia irregularis]|uniref:Uncharacterized protein n=1 Tax=Parafrankia irregularis TaxID=795642 RepID=A0A0S4R0N7_9ACTN|nr:hypothetical protein [Parafrankia sp. CH37]MBE3200404.1 hypothetical protein [Parafrankia sp. CH37]CUU61081.1 hypothetical protein Ga0074812_15517 [Parafrankia irregularis]
MPVSSVSYGTIDMYDALPPHPCASWEPGNVGSFSLRITALLDESGGILVHVDTALTLEGAEEPPIRVLVDDGEVYSSPATLSGDCAEPDHGHPVPWRTAEG